MSKLTAVQKPIAMIFVREQAAQVDDPFDNAAGGVDDDDLVGDIDVGPDPVSYTHLIPLGGEPEQGAVEHRCVDVVPAGAVSYTHLVRGCHTQNQTLHGG